MRLTKAQIAPTKPKEDKETRYGLNLTLVFAELEGKKSIRHWLSLESRSNATADQKQMDALRLKELLVATGIDQDALVQAYKQSRANKAAVDVPELIGCEPYAIITEPVEDPNYGLQNRISRFVTSK
jgi:hypothetical protein